MPEVADSLTNNAEVDIPEGSTLVVSGSLVNNGAILVNANNGLGGATLNFNSNTNLSGTGSIVLRVLRDYGTWLSISGGCTLTQGAGHTIAGIGAMTGALVNAGTVVANVSGQRLDVLGASAWTNSGTLKGTNGGSLNFSGSQVSVTQSPAGTILADGGGVNFTGNSQISGGTLDSRNGGAVGVNGATLSNLTNVGDLELNGNAAFSNVTNQNILNVSAGNAATLSGSNFVNNGIFTINPSGANAATSLTITSDFTLSGTGSLVLNPFGNNFATAQIIASNGATLTQSSGHLIRGAGYINSPLNNDGLILADGPGKQLHLLGATMNSGTLMATNGAWLDINGSQSYLTQSAGGMCLADGGYIGFINDAHITGGVFDSRNGGSVVVGQGHTATLSNISNMGALRQDYGGTAILSGSSFVNNGTFTVNTTAENATTIVNISSNLILSGTGSLVLNPFGNNFATAQIIASNGATLTQSSGHLIRGAGYINSPLNNDGLILADGPGKQLHLLGATMNSGTLMATNGAWLDINGSQSYLTQSAGGMCLADGGYIGFINDAHITGGVFDSRNGGSVVVGQGHTATLSNISNMGALRQDYGGTAILSGSSFVNNGTFTVNTTAENATTTVNIGSNVLLSGTGRLILNANGANGNSARITASGGAVLTQAAEHTVQGKGRVYTPINNAGLILGNGTGSALELYGQISNTGTIKSTATGGLYVACTVNQTGDGKIIADGGVLNFGNAANISGGTLENQNGGLLCMTSGNANFSNLTIFGDFTVNPNGENGMVTFNVGGNVLLDGTGQMILNANPADSNSAQLASSNGATLTQAAGHSIVGQGKISCTLNNDGLILSTGLNLSLVLSGQVTNTGMIETIPGGNLQIIGPSGAITQSGT